VKDNTDLPRSIEANLRWLPRQLGIKKQILEADIRDMAWVWEEAVGEICQPSPRAVFSILRVGTRSYLRGRGLRMGNWQGWEQHGLTESWLMMCLISYVVKESSGHTFRALRQAGLTSIEAFVESMRRHLKAKEFDILVEVRQMLGGD